MAFHVIEPDEPVRTTRPHEPRDLAGFAHTRANLWRYEPGAKGRRHRHLQQEETFVVLAGTLSMYPGEPPQRRDVPAGGPPEHEHAELLEAAV
jgi:quercetin dioxygenase-like cupin family protein